MLQLPYRDVYVTFTALINHPEILRHKFPEPNSATQLLVYFIIPAVYVAFHLYSPAKF